MEKNNYFVQKDKYRKRGEKFLMMGGASIIATMGLVVAAPALGTLAIPLLVAGAATGHISLAGFAANKIAENNTDVYEEKTMRQRFSNGIKTIRAKALGTENTDTSKLKS